MSSRALLLALLAGCTVVLAGSCASHKRPVLYPNDHYTSVGDQQAQADIEACMEFAASQVEQYRKAEEATEQGAKGAVAGAAGGAAAGAVGGGSIGRSAGMGAAAGAAIGIVSGLWRGSEPDPLFQRFVDECLREKGYSPQGWR